jgi:tetratricopeptide (TPR) repeat protein
VNNLGSLLQSKGDYAAAEPLYHRALETSERTLGEEHPETLISVNNLGHFLISKGDYEAAHKMLLSASERAVRCWGEEHPITARIKYHYFCCLPKIGKSELPVKEMEALCELLEKKKGTEHKWTIDFRELLAKVMGDY